MVFIVFGWEFVFRNFWFKFRRCFLFGRMIWFILGYVIEFLRFGGKKYIVFFFKFRINIYLL